MELTEEALIEYINKTYKDVERTTKFIKFEFKGKIVEVSVYKPKSNGNYVETYMKNKMNKNTYSEEEWEKVVEMFRSDVKIISQSVLDSCLEIAEKNVGDEDVDVLLKILLEEVEYRKTKNLSSDWLGDVFGGDE